MKWWIVPTAFKIQGALERQPIGFGWALRPERLPCNDAQDRSVDAAMTIDNRLPVTDKQNKVINKKVGGWVLN